MSSTQTTIITTPTPAAIELSRIPTKSRSSELEQITVHDEEQSRPSSPQPPEGAVVFSRPDVSAVKLQLISMNFSVFLCGVNDAATGALVPYLQPAYNIGLLFVALVYLFNFAGWTAAAFSNVHLTARVGTGGVMLIGAVLQFIAHSLQFWKPPFPLFVITYLIAGMGIALQDAQANSFVGGVNDAHRWLGVLHAVYGLGALISPLIATKIASSTPYWHYFYCVLMSIAAINIGLILMAFKKGLGKGAAGARERAGSDLKKTISNRVVILMSLFFFVYVGAEVTAGGESTPP